MDIDQQNGDVAIDLEGYIANYSGHAKIDRLIFIADHAQGTPLELDALKIAATELKQTANTKLYRDVTNRIGNRAGPEFEYDSNWATSIDRRTELQADQLESDLNTARSNLVKESIRLAYLALGDVRHGAGDLQAAFKHYMRCRDYCSTPKHIIQMCLNIIRCSIEMKNYMHVANYVQKADATPEVKDDPITLGKLACAMGLNYLTAAKYKAAALKFTDVPSELGNSYNDVLSAADIAAYGGLCAMASFTRQELKNRVVENARLREYMDAAPEIRDAVQFFYSSRYTECLNLLDRVKPQLLLDLHLRENVAALYAAVRAKALTQYVAPYSTLDLESMAEAFHTDIEGLEKELAGLIASKDINARIDSHAKVLCARSTDQRVSTFRRAVQAGEDHVKATKALLLRASMIRFDLVQRPAASAVPERGEGGPAGRHGRAGRDRGERRDRFDRGEASSLAALFGRGGGGGGGFDDMMRMD